jgi:hypothetical protein
MSATIRGGIMFAVLIDVRSVIIRYYSTFSNADNASSRLAIGAGGTGFDMAFISLPLVHRRIVLSMKLLLNNAREE